MVKSLQLRVERSFLKLNGLKLTALWSRLSSLLNVPSRDSEDHALGVAVVTRPQTVCGLVPLDDVTMPLPLQYGRQGH